MERNQSYRGRQSVASMIMIIGIDESPFTHHSNWNFSKDSKELPLYGDISTIKKKERKSIVSVYTLKRLYFNQIIFFCQENVNKRSTYLFIEYLMIIQE